MLQQELMEFGPLVPLRVYAAVMKLDERTARERARQGILGVQCVQLGGPGTARMVYRDDLARLAFRYEAPRALVAA